MPRMLISSPDLTTFLIIIKILCIPSVIALLMIIIIFWFFKETRGFSMETVIYLAVLEIFYELSMLLPFYQDNPEGSLCAVQSFLVNFFLHAKYLWMCLVGYCCLTNILKPYYLERHQMFYRLLFFSLCFPIPLSLSFMLLFTKTYGNSGGYCLYAYDSDSKWYFLRKIHLTLLNARICEVILMLFILAKILVILRKMKKMNKYKEGDYEHMKYYLVIGILSSVITCINMSYTIISENPFNFWVNLLQLLVNSSEGFQMFIVFLLTPGLRHSILTVYQNVTRQQLEREDSLLDGSRDGLYPSIVDEDQQLRISQEDDAYSERITE